VYAGSAAHPEAILKPGTNEKEHPAQMPLGLASRAILFSTDPGDIVLDPFSGSGTTVLASTNLNRYGIGIEDKDEYHDLAAKRIAQAARQEPLFTV
jgi:site-specific DNA-methyltransferase (adenine-specific)